MSSRTVIAAVHFLTASFLTSLSGLLSSARHSAISPFFVDEKKRASPLDIMACGQTAGSRGGPWLRTQSPGCEFRVWRDACGSCAKHCVCHKTNLSNLRRRLRFHTNYAVLISCLAWPALRCCFHFPNLIAMRFVYRGT